jgi:hypothetical protein
MENELMQNAALDLRELLHLEPPYKDRTYWPDWRPYTNRDRFEAIMVRFFTHQRENPEASIEESWAATMVGLLERDKMLTKLLKHCSKYARNN